MYMQNNESLLKACICKSSLDTYPTLNYHENQRVGIFKSSFTLFAVISAVKIKFEIFAWKIRTKLE